MNTDHRPASLPILIFKTIWNDILPVPPDACWSHEYTNGTEGCFGNDTEYECSPKADIANKFLNLK